MLAAGIGDKACAQAAAMAMRMICFSFGIDYLTALHRTPHVPGVVHRATKNFYNTKRVLLGKKNPYRFSFHVFSGSFMMSQDIPVAKD